MAAKGISGRKENPQIKETKFMKVFFLLKYLNILLKLSELKMFIKIY